MKKHLYWIKERYNPQLGTYYIALGQLTRESARKHEVAKYGENTMHPFNSEDDYRARIKELKDSGDRVQE